MAVSELCREKVWIGTDKTEGGCEMTDRELLELAAKANWPEDSDVGFRFDTHEDAIVYLDAKNQDHNGRDVEYVWNPLTDDGDALRLAVKLDLDLIKTNDLSGDDAHYCTVTASTQDRFEAVEYELDDPYAAMRRAIVRAAAEIGKTE